MTTEGGCGSLLNKRLFIGLRVTFDAFPLHPSSTSKFFWAPKPGCDTAGG